MTNLKMFEEIKIQSVPLQIAEAIRKKIYEGTLKPNDKIPKQEELSELFSVSRPTIREALSFLIDAHLIEPATGREGGYVVCSFHPENVLKNMHDIIMLSLTFHTLTPRHVFEMRKMLEVPGAALAAERRTEEDLTQLEQILPTNIAVMSVQEVLDADVRFHMKLAECTHNPLAKTIQHALTLAYFKIPQRVTHDRDMILTHLPEVLLAVKEQNPDQAREAMIKHFNLFEKSFD